MPRELAILPVYRHEVARSDQREHELQLFLAAVARHVHVLRALVHDVGAAPRDVIHHAADAPFRCPESRAPKTPPCRPARAGRAGDRRWRSSAAPPAALPANRCTGTRRPAPGSCATSLSRICTPAGIRKYPSRCAISEFSCIPRPTNATLPIELRREIHDYLHPVDARRERGDDDLASGAGENLLERVDDIDLGSAEPLALDVRAVAEQHETPAAPSWASRCTSTCSPSSGV